MEVTRLVERTFRDSRAVDLEALCVIAGRKVWKALHACMLHHPESLHDHLVPPPASPHLRWVAKEPLQQ